MKSLKNERVLTKIIIIMSTSLLPLTFWNTFLRAQKPFLFVFVLDALRKYIFAKLAYFFEEIMKNFAVKI